MNIAKPWSVSLCTAADARQFPYCIRDASGWSVAYVTGSLAAPHTQEAAALIASAPALLDALLVVYRNHAHRAYLEAHDPKALEQISDALHTVMRVKGGA